jgi:hypothetical protein
MPGSTSGESSPAPNDVQPESDAGTGTDTMPTDDDPEHSPRCIVGDHLSETDPLTPFWRSRHSTTTGQRHYQAVA